MSDEPIAALKETVERNHRDVVKAIDALGERMDRYVLERVYNAEVGALRDTVKELKEEAEQDRKTARANEQSSKQTARNAIITSIGGFLGALALVALTAWVHSGGH